MVITKAKSLKYSFCLLATLVVAASCSNPNSSKVKTEEEKFSELSEKYPEVTDVSEENDEINGSLYRNTKYRFRIRFPENWNLIKGNSKATVIKGVQTDSGKSISIIVEHLKDVELRSKEIDEQSLEKAKEDLISTLKLQNQTPTNIGVAKGFLNNFPATITTCNTIIRSQEYEIEYRHQQISCTKNGKLYIIFYSAPTLLLNRDDENRFAQMIQSFVFEI